MQQQQEQFRQLYGTLPFSLGTQPHAQFRGVQQYNGLQQYNMLQQATSLPLDSNMRIYSATLYVLLYSLRQPFQKRVAAVIRGVFQRVCANFRPLGFPRLVETGCSSPFPLGVAMSRNPAGGGSAHHIFRNACPREPAEGRGRSKFARTSGGPRKFAAVAESATLSACPTKILSFCFILSYCLRLVAMESIDLPDEFESVFVQQTPVEDGSQVWSNGVEAANAAELNLMLAGRAVPSQASASHHLLQTNTMLRDVLPYQGSLLQTVGAAFRRPEMQLNNQQVFRDCSLAMETVRMAAR